MRGRRRLFVVVVLAFLGTFAWVAVAATPGTISTFAGTPDHFGNGEVSGSATGANAYLGQPYGLAVDPSGDVLIVDDHYGQLLFVASSSCAGSMTVTCPYGLSSTTPGDIYRIAGPDGSFTAGYAGDNGPATTNTVKLNNPEAVALDANGDALIADFANDVVRLVARSSCTPAASCPFGLATTAGYIYTIAGDHTAGYTGIPGSATGAELDLPSGVALDARGDLLVSNYSASTVDVVAASACQSACPYGLSTMAAGDIYPVVGSPGNSGFSANGTAASSALLSRPTGLAVDGNGDVLIADPGNEVVSLLAGASCSSASTCPYGLSSMTAGDVYTVAGGGNSATTSGVAATSEMLDAPEDVAVDARGDLLIADYNGQVVQLVADFSCTSSCPFGLSSMTKGDVYTIAGDGTAGEMGDSGPATSIELNGPYGLALDGSGDLYIADVFNDVVREVTGGPPDASASLSTIKASPASVVADGVSKSTITVQTKDADGTDFSAGGDAVTIASTLGTVSSVTDHGDGTYTATLTSSHTGTADVSASVNGHAITSGDASVKFTAVPVAPIVSHFAQSHSKWAEKKSKAKHSPPVGTTFSFTLSEKATVTLTLRRVKGGHAATVGALSVKGVKGKNSVKFSGVLKGKHLPAGSYRVTLTATANGKASKSTSLTFKIVS